MTSQQRRQGLGNSWPLVQVAYQSRFRRKEGKEAMENLVMMINGKRCGNHDLPFSCDVTHFCTGSHSRIKVMLVYVEMTLLHGRAKLLILA
jgi:hypothetical protein